MVPTGYNSFIKKHDGPDGRSPKLTRRVFTGCLLGAVVSMWIFSGMYGFLAAFVWMAIVAQNEYYFMARQKGVYPTWKLGMLGSVCMYLAAASQLLGVQEAMLPLTGTVCIVYLLLRQEPSTPPTTMTDVSTTFMGIWYLGYMPSFWARHIHIQTRTGTYAYTNTHTHTCLYTHTHTRMHAFLLDTPAPGPAVTAQRSSSLWQIRLRTLGPLPVAGVLSLFLPPAVRGMWPVVAIEASSLGQTLFTQGAIVQACCRRAVGTLQALGIP
jgi:hypothetical protein